MGESPITLALEEAGKVFPEPSDDTLNVILLIADDIDTCNSTPADEAKTLSENQNIVIYTISFLGGANDLEPIAQNASGKNFNVPGFLNTNKRASEELNKAIKSAFDDILSRVSTPVLPTYTLTNTPTPTSTTTPTPSDTATPTPTGTPTRTIPGSNSPEPIPTEEPPSPVSPIGILVFVMIVVVVLVFGFWFWKSRTTTKGADKLPEPENTILMDEDDILKKFRDDLYKAYSPIGDTSPGTKKYMPLILLKEKLANKYTPEQFDELLIQARRKYPNKIWIDKNSKGQTIVKVNP
jgi:hypothetical protein